MAAEREGRRPLAVGSHQPTEFASKSYFEKYEQQQRQQLQQQQQDVRDAPSIPHNSAKFILPLRESKTNDPIDAKQTEQKREKRGFFSIRQRVSALHKSSHVHLPTIPATTPARPSVDSTAKSASLDDLFKALPAELQVEILSSLPLSDLLNLRLASKSYHTLVMTNETTLARQHLETQIPAYVHRLYPISSPSEATLHHLCGLWHRLHVAAKLAHMMCNWITKDIFFMQTEAQKLAFAPQTERMRRRLIPILFTLFHFFEMYRIKHLEYLEKDPGYAVRTSPYTVDPIEAQIMSMYDDQTLLRVHEAFPLVISSFCRRLRPPTYVGRVERSLRGYIRDKPSDEVYTAILCLGGLGEVEKLWGIKGYNTRRAAVDTFYNGLTRSSSADPPVKPRRGLMGFARRKSTTHDRDGARRASLGDAAQRNRSPPPNSAYRDVFYEASSVFSSSMSAGAPMSPISQGSAQRILNDLPKLQQIWMMTAETLILERGIVESDQYIKRNQAVMMDLIREDGLWQEDEWLYGVQAPDSVKGPVANIHDDHDFS